MLLSMLDTPLTDIWHDTAFQFVVLAFITLLAGAIGGIVSLWIFRKQRKRKEISYYIISDAPIANINKEVEDRVEVHFDGKPVKNMRLLVLKLQNSGNVAIKRDDYDEPIKFAFEGRIVVSADVLSMEPKDLLDVKDIQTLFTLELESIRLAKFLLNPKETITFKVLLTGSEGKIKGKARIVDGEIKEFNEINQELILDAVSTITNVLAFIPLITVWAWLAWAVSAYGSSKSSLPFLAQFSGSFSLMALIVVIELVLLVMFIVWRRNLYKSVPEEAD